MQEPLRVTVAGEPTTDLPLHTAVDDEDEEVEEEMCVSTDVAIHSCIDWQDSQALLGLQVDAVSLTLHYDAGIIWDDKGVIRLCRWFSHSIDTRNCNCHYLRCMVCVSAFSLCDGKIDASLSLITAIIACIG